MIESGVVEALTASGTGRVKRNTGLARGSRAISELRVVIWKPDQIFKKSGVRAVSREGNRPLLFPVFLSLFLVILLRLDFRFVPNASISGADRVLGNIR
jgi:hypothetical protein